MPAEYDVIKILRPTRQELDKIKKSGGYPSYNQAITALVERKLAKDEIMMEIKSELAEEAAKVVASMFYQFMLEMAKDVRKPMSEVTLNDLFAAMQKMSPK